MSGASQTPFRLWRNGVRLARPTHHEKNTINIKHVAHHAGRFSTTVPSTDGFPSTGGFSKDGFLSTGGSPKDGFPSTGVLSWTGVSALLA